MSTDFDSGSPGHAPFGMVGTSPSWFVGAPFLPSTGAPDVWTLAVLCGRPVLLARSLANSSVPIRGCLHPVLGESQGDVGVLLESVWKWQRPAVCVGECGCFRVELCCVLRMVQNGSRESREFGASSWRKDKYGENSFDRCRVWLSCGCKIWNPELMASGR